MVGHPWWFVYTSAADEQSLYWCLGGILALNLCILILGPVVNRAHQRTGSAELFFFAISLYSLCFESFRATVGLTVVLNTPSYVGIAFSRAVYFGRLCSLLTLLLSSLYSMNMDYSRFGMLLGISVLVSLSLSLSVPVDSTAFLSNLLYKLGEERALWFVTLVLSLLAVLNLCGAALAKKSTHLLYAAVALLVHQTGREMLFFSINLYTSVVGVALLCLGTILFYKQLEAHYLWI